MTVQPPALQPLIEAVGRTITRIRRVHYTFRGVPDTDFGPLELAFGADVVLVDNASDGETLRVRSGPWEDPFAEPLGPENRAFVARSGRWSAYDVSGDGAFASMVGDVLSDVEPVVGRAGRVTGAVLRTARGGLVRVDVECDELFVNRLVAGGEGRGLSGRRARPDRR